jgi:hypothetical protein
MQDELQMKRSGPRVDSDEVHAELVTFLDPSTARTASDTLVATSDTAASRRGASNGIAIASTSSVSSPPLPFNGR